VIRFAILGVLVGTGCGRIAFDAKADGGGSQVLDAAPDGSHGGITFVQADAMSFGTSTTGALAYPMPVVAGDLLVVGLDHDNIAATATITDTIGSTWQLTKPNSGFDLERIAYAIAPASGNDVVTVKLDQPPVSYLEVRVHEYRGAAAVPYDGEAENASDTMPATVAITTHKPGEMVFAMAILDTAVAGTAGAGYTLRLSYAGDVTEDRIVDVPQTLAAVVDYNATAAWTITAVVFSPG